MADEQTIPAPRGGVGADEVPTADSGSGASAGRRKPSSGRSAGWWAVCSVLVVLVVIIGGYGCLLYVSLNPDIGPDGFQVGALPAQLPTTSQAIPRSPQQRQQEQKPTSTEVP